MSLTVNTREFLKEMEWAGRFVESKGTIPILRNVRINTTVGGVQITGTDMESAGVTEVRALVCEPLDATVDVKQFTKCLKKVSEPEVKIMAYQKHLVIMHGTYSTAELPTIPAESYPEMPVIETTMELTGLAAALPRIAIAISAEESRFTLNGALLDIGASGAKLVSTDGHRLSVVDIGCDGGVQSKTLISRAALDELVRVKADSAYFGMDDNHITFVTNNRRIISRKLKGNFPDYERVMPSAFDYAVSFGTAALMKVIERVSLFADTRSRAMIYTVNEGSLEVFAKTEAGSAKGKIAVNAGESVELDWKAGFNWSHIVDFLKGAPENAVFQFNQPKDAAELRAGNWRYVVMPMRI